MVSEFVKAVNHYVVQLCQLLAIFVITLGVCKALYIYIKDALFGKAAKAAINESRLELGHSFSLGLGFLIGASILKTTLAPTWDDIGQLAAIISIRTILNFFLLREIGKQSAGKSEAGNRTQETPRAEAERFNRRN